MYEFEIAFVASGPR